jgi:hypothetical protein
VKRDRRQKKGGRLKPAGDATVATARPRTTVTAVTAASSHPFSRNKSEESREEE